MVDHQGNPVSNASISITGVAASPRHIDPDNMTKLFAPFQIGIKTDDQGAWRFTGAPEDLVGAILFVRDPNGAEARFSTGELTIHQKHYLSGDPIRLADLRSGKVQTSLAEGTDIDIQVTDQSGRPIANTRIEELFGTPIKQRGIVKIADKSGMTSFLRRTKKELLYMASHPRYASSSVIARPGNDRNPLKIVLPDRQPISGIVVDSSGSPVTGALISLHPFLNEKFSSKWRTVTGADGRFVWREAPKIETFLQIQTPDFKTVVISISPTNDQPIKISLSNSDTFRIKISARIVDAHTEQPLSQFEYRLRRDHGSSRAGWTSGRNGLVKIQTTYRELTQKHLQSKGTFYQIDCRALGYQADYSRRLNINEINPSLEIALQPIQKQHDLGGIQVLTPDGMPVRQAKAFLIGLNHHSMPNFDVLPSRLDSNSFQTDYRFQTGSDGKFPAMPYPHRFRGIVVTSEQGTVALPSDSLELSSRTIRLKALGAIEGTMSIGGWTQSNRKIAIVGSQPSLPLFNLWAHSEIGSNGSFRFENLLDGDYRLHIYRPGPLEGQRTPTYQRSVQVRGGITQHFNYANRGREVSGRFVSTTLPSPIDFVGGRFYLHSAKTASFVLPRPRPDEYVYHRSFSTENEEYTIRRQGIERRSERSYYLNLTSTGEFIVDSIPPGEYILEAQIMDPRLEEPLTPRHFMFGGKPLAHLSLNVTIPSGDPLDPIDLGEIMINRPKEKNRPSERQGPISNAVKNTPSTATHPVKVEKMETLLPSEIEISVVDFLSDQPMREAYVTVEIIGNNATDTQISETNRFRTNEYGKINIEWTEPVAFVHVQARTRGYLALKKSFRPYMQPLPERYEFRLERGKSIYGRVTDDAGKPIPRVKVAVTHFGTHRYGNSVVEPENLPETNALGRWHFDEIPPDVEMVYLQFLHPRMAMSIEEIDFERPQSSNQKRHIVENPIESTTKVRDIVLTPGEHLSGKVVDHNQAPVMNANVKILESCCANATTDSNGEFEFPGSYVGPISLLITAPGASPRIVKTFVGPGVTPLVYQLEEGQRQTFEFVDPSGNPVQGVNVVATKWAEHYFGYFGPLAISDSFGRIDWSSAPREAVDYIVLHKDYAQQTIKRLSPRGTPYRMTLYPKSSITVTFRVTDQAGKPIPDFEIKSGRPTELPASPYSINWDWRRKTFGSNGLLRRTENVESNDSAETMKEKYIYRVESFGYAPHVSRVIESIEKDVTLDIVLKLATTQRGILLDTNGRPMANHRLKRIEQGNAPRIQQSVLASGPTNGKSVKTDISGRFELPRTETPYALLGVNSDGYALIPSPETTEVLTISLERWGRINGHWFDGESPVKGKALGFRLAANSSRTVPAPIFEDLAITDSSGRFEFNKVPPGIIEIVEIRDSRHSMIKTNLTIRPNSEIFLELR